MGMTRRDALKGAGAAMVGMTGLGAATPLAAADPFGYLSHDALGLAALVRSRQVSASELLETAIGRAEAVNQDIDFMAQKLYAHGRGAVANRLHDGLFCGVPFLIKDLNCHIEGTRSGQGSRLYNAYIAPHTSELVRRHQAAGLVIFGKTATPEFGLTGTTESIATGATRNPWNLAHSAGGSSGGAAAAVAAGVVPIAHASDGGGSIRIPASCCGLFGIKPSRGRIPMGPGRTEGWGGLSTNGAISRSVRDSAAMFDATAGLEPGSRYAAPSPDGSFLSQCEREPGALRIALMLEPISGSPIDSEILAATRAAARLCETLGHHVTEASLRFDAARLGQANFAVIATAMAADVDARAAAAGLTVGPDVLEPITIGFYQVGKSMSGTDVARAHATLQEAAIASANFMVDYDVILSPTLARPPAPLGELDLNHADFAAWGQRVSTYSPFTGLYNATGQPSMSVPLAMSATGLPLGMMFTARYGEEALLIRLAAQLERAQPWRGLAPSVV